MSERFVTNTSPTPTERNVFVTVGPSGSSALYVTDGTADDVEINAAIQYAVDGGLGVVRLLPGTYSLDAPVLLASNVTLEGSGAGATRIVVSDMFAATNYFAVGAYGTETTGTAIDVAVDTAHGDTTITGTAGAELSAVAVDDYLFLCSDDAWETTNTTGRKLGEFVKVYSVSGTTISIYGMVRDTYLVSSNAKLYRMSFVQNVGVRDFEIYQHAADGTRTGNPPPLVGFHKCRNAFVQNLNVHNNDGPGVSIHSTIDSVVKDCFIHDLWDETGNNRYGYGVLITAATENLVVSGCRFDRMRHAITTGSTKSASGAAITLRGISRGVSIIGNVGMHCTNTVFDTHVECENFLFAGNVASNSDNWGFFVRGRASRILNNSVEWCTGGINVGSAAYDSASGQGSATEVVGNSVKYIKLITPSVTGANGGGGQAYGEGITVALTDHCVIKGNAVSFCDGAGISLLFGTRRSIVEGNTILNCNLDNGSSSECDAIALTGQTFSGSSASITYSAGTVTLTGLSGITSTVIGSTIVVSGSATPGNNGSFTILTAPGSTSVTYANASGANDASGTLAWYVEGVTDNLIMNNVAMNAASSATARGNTRGRMKRFAKDYATSGNVRNVFRGNVGVGMETGLLSIGSNFEAGTSATESTPVKTSAGAPTDASFSATPQAGSLALDTTNGSLYYRGASTWATVTSTLRGSSGTVTVPSDTTAITWASATSAPSITQSGITSGSGTTLLISAQSTTDVAGTGGSLFLSAGTGGAANGTVRLCIGGSTGLQITPSASAASSVTCVAGATSWTFSQSDKTANSATGATLTMRAQNATGTTSTGGALTLTSGTGTSADGLTTLQCGGTNILQCNSSIADGETGILVRRNVSGAYTLQRVSMGAADSGGAGYKVLRVPN